MGENGSGVDTCRPASAEQKVKISEPEHRLCFTLPPRDGARCPRVPTLHLNLGQFAGDVSLCWNLHLDKTEKHSYCKQKNKKQNKTKKHTYIHSNITFNFLFHLWSERKYVLLTRFVRGQASPRRAQLRTRRPESKITVERKITCGQVLLLLIRWRCERFLPSLQPLNSQHM